MTASSKLPELFLQLDAADLMLSTDGRPGLWSLFLKLTAVYNEYDIHFYVHEVNVYSETYIIQLIDRSRTFHFLAVAATMETRNLD